jgi:hypothetical protein
MILGLEPAVRIRRGATTYADGVAVPGASVSEPIRVSPEPASRRTMERAGRGDEHGLEVVTYDELRAASDVAGHYADRVAYDGRTYEVVDARIMRRMPGVARTHYEALLVELQPMRAAGGT